LPPGFRAPAG